MTIASRIKRNATESTLFSSGPRFDGTFSINFYAIVFRKRANT